MRLPLGGRLSRVLNGPHPIGACDLSGAALTSILVRLDIGTEDTQLNHRLCILNAHAILFFFMRLCKMWPWLLSIILDPMRWSFSYARWSLKAFGRCSYTARRMVPEPLSASPSGSRACFSADSYAGRPCGGGHLVNTKTPSLFAPLTTADCITIRQ